MRKLLSWLGIAGSVGYLIWAGVAVSQGHWALTVVMTALWLLALRTAAISGFAGLIVAIFTGQWWLVAAFASITISRTGPGALPLWSMKPRTSPKVLASALDQVAPMVADALASTGHPISTRTLAEMAIAEAPDPWGGDLKPSQEGEWDGPVLRDRSGRAWTWMAAEAVITGGQMIQVGTPASPVQAYAAGALVLPGNMLDDALPDTRRAFEIAGRLVRLNASDLIEVGKWFVHQPGSEDMIRRLEFRMVLDPDGLIPAVLLFALTSRDLWLLSLARWVTGRRGATLALAAITKRAMPAASRPPKTTAAPPRPSSVAPRPGTTTPSALTPPVPAPPAATGTIPPRRTVPAPPPRRTVPAPHDVAREAGRAASSARRRKSRLGGRIWRYLGLCAKATSWPDAAALRIARPLCTLAAACASCLLDVPWWWRVLVAVSLLLIRPLKRWWGDIILAVVVGLPPALSGVGGAVGLLPAAAVLLGRAAVTGSVVQRRGLRAAVVTPRQEFLATILNSPADRIGDPDGAWHRYTTALRTEPDDMGDAAVAYLQAVWTTGDASALFQAAVKVVRIQALGHTPDNVGAPSAFRRLTSLYLVDKVVRWLVAVPAVVGCGLTALLFAPHRDLGVAPLGWVAAAGGVLLVVLVVRERPAFKTAVVVGGAGFLGLGNHALPPLAVAAAGASLSWAARRALTRRTMNTPRRLAWVGARTTGLRSHADLRAAGYLEVAGRPGIAVDVLTRVAAVERDRRPAAAAVALAHCALIERDRGELQWAVEHAVAARALVQETRSRATRTARAVTAYASGIVDFAVGDYPAARQALTGAEPMLRGRPEASTCATTLAQVHAALGEPDDAMSAARRTSGRATGAGQLPALVEAQLAVGWAFLRDGRASEASGLIEDLVRYFQDPFNSDDADPDERTRDLWRRLMGEASLLLGRIDLVRGDAAAAGSHFESAVGHLRPTASTDLLGMVRIYQGECLRRDDRHTEAAAAVKDGVRLLEKRREQLRLGTHRASAVAAGTDHYDTALGILVDAQHRGDVTAGIDAADLIESMRRNALASTLRDHRATFADRFPPAVREAMAEIARLESTLELGGGSSGGAEVLQRISELRDALEDEVSHGFAEAYLPETVDYPRLSAVASQAHVLQFELLKVDQDQWRGYRVWVTPGGTPTVDRVTVRHPGAIELLTAVRAGTEPSALYEEFDLNTDLWSALASTLLPPGLVDELRTRDDSTPVRLLVVPGEHLAYVPWALLVLDDTTEESILLHKAVIQVVPSLTLLRPHQPAQHSGSGAVLAYLDADARALIARGGEPAQTWNRLTSSLSVIPTSSREQFEGFLSDPRIDGVYLIAHGDGTGLRQSINFTEGGKFSAAAALRFHWPRTMVLASCLVAKVEQQSGQEPLGLVIACMLGGCHAFIGGVISVERDATGQISTDAAIALAGGQDPAAALRDAQRAYLAREGSVFPNEWAGLLCISIEWRDEV